MGRLILKNKTVLFGVSVFTAILMSSIALAPLVNAGGTLPDKLTECTCMDFVRLSVDDLVCFDFDLGLNTEEVVATCELLCQNNGGHRFLIQFNPDDPACIDPPLETEKFYTETDKDIEDGFFGTVLPFKNGIVDTGNPTQVVKAVVDRNDNIKSYNPGQYYAVTKVTALQDLDEVWITEDDRACTEGDQPISKMNPARVPGGAYVALMCEGVSVDLSSELAKSGALKINDDGIVEAHVEDVPEGCMVYLGVKYSPGLKGENVQSIDQPWCENWEFVEALTESGDVFTDSAHRVLEVIGLPEVCGNGFLEGAEECDDGNTDDTDSCLTTCEAAFCGDGFTQTDVEECDDGNDVNDDECTNECTIPLNPPTAENVHLSVTETMDASQPDQSMGTLVFGNLLDDGMVTSNSPLTLLVSDVNGIPIIGQTSIAGESAILIISPNGDYSLTADNSNPVVNALAEGEMLLESFGYSVEDEIGQASSDLEIWVNGANDSPQIGDFMIMVKETMDDDVPDPSMGTKTNGNILEEGSATDPDFGDLLSVFEVQGVIINSETVIVGNIVLMTVSPNGDYMLIAKNDDPTVNALGEGDFLDEDFVFTIGDVGGKQNSATFAIIVKGANDSPQVPD